jgi:hypothetical protein
LRQIGYFQSIRLHKFGELFDSGALPLFQALIHNQNSPKVILSAQKAATLLM